jgi:transcriptional regulator with XRE-family HTH domain
VDINLTVAQNIKAIREAKKLTLDAAAKLTSVSRSMLAQIEKGDVNPTISVLWKIANGYKVSFTSLTNASDDEIVVISSETTTPLIADDGKYINYPIFTFNEQRLFETYRIEIAPNGVLSAQPHLAGTEEYITVFDGSVDIIVENEIYHLQKGDSIKFKANTNHGYKNAGDNTAFLSMLIYYPK